MNFESAVGFLKSFNPYEDKGFPAYNEKNFNLDRIRKFLKAYKVDYKKLKCVHVTGSKGKSSCCKMIGDYLVSSGYKTGVFTTPYILDITECISVNGKDVSKKVFTEHVLCLKNFLKVYKGPILTYFEFLTVIVLKFFVDEKVDFAVIEVGLGGRLDATNVIKADVAVLAVVEKEHTGLLGRTYAKILDEKLGIAVGKNVRNLVVGRQIPYVEKIVRKKTSDVKNVVFVKETGNRAIVFEVLKMLFKSVDEKIFDKVTANFGMIGRLDIRSYKGKWVVFDMAHTKNSVEFLLKELRKKNADKKLYFLVSVMKNKNLKNVLLPICEAGSMVVVTSSNVDRGFMAEELRNYAKKHGFSVLADDDCESAFEDLLKKTGANNILVVTGSHFLVGRILRRFF